MSRIAALLVLYAAQVDRAPVTAEQALAASRAMISIGRDPCRDTGGREEIVVCARRDSPYALPSSTSPAKGVAAITGDAAEFAVDEMQRLGSACRARGDCSLRPLVVIGKKF